MVVQMRIGIVGLSDLILGVDGQDRSGQSLFGRGQHTPEADYEADDEKITNDVATNIGRTPDWIVLFET